jgi:glycerophosphoryl diester phosphodiesterase
MNPRYGWTVALLVLLILGTGLGAVASYEGILVIAHRGDSPGFPENTLAAFSQAIALGVDVIEVDLQTTKDGVVVLLHDDTVDRTTNGKGFVSDYTLDEIRELDAGAYAGARFEGEHIPTLEEALDLVIPQGVKLILDVKDGRTIDRERLVRLLVQHGATLDVILGVRSLEDAQQFRSLAPNIRQLAFLPGAMDMDEFVEAGVDIVRLWARWIHTVPRFVEMVHARGKPVWVTSEFAGREELVELADLGADGFITDLPDVLLTLIGDSSTE